MKEFNVEWYKILILDEKISKDKLIDKVGFLWGNLIKAVVDVDKEIMAVWWELHVDWEQILLENGSNQSSLWWINLYLKNNKEDWIEYDSMINIRPKDNNFSRFVENEEIRQKISKIVYNLIN